MKRVLVKISTLVAAAILLATIAASAAGTTGTVNGTVTRSGNPVEGARVVIDSKTSSMYGAVTRTDANGAFSFAGAPLGDVNLKVYDAKDQLAATGKGELLFDGQAITVTLEIAP